MDKEYLLDLIARINTEEENFKNSTETIRWKALREAETLADPALFPLLREIVGEHEGKKEAERKVRNAVYFIYGRLLEAAFSPEDAAFLLARLDAETNKYVLHSILDRVRDWRDRKGILLPPELDTSAIRRLAKNDQWLVRHAAIHALCACPGPESREVLDYWLAQEDEKKYKSEMWYAAIALQTVGEPEDIPLLERFLKSRRPDLKITARYAIQYIKERQAAGEQPPAPKEVIP